MGHNLDLINSKHSEKELEKHIRFFDRFDWYFISVYQSLSESFIEKYKGEVDWAEISLRQTLSEAFIEKYQDEVDWTYISLNQKLSKDFIQKHLDKLSTNLLLGNKYISQETKAEIEILKDII